MDYKKAEHKNGIYFYPNDTFNTISIRLNFMAKSDNDKAPIYDLLCYFLTKSNQKYPTDDDISEREKELYSLQLYFSNLFYGKQKVFSLNANMIAPDLLQEDYSKEAFEFIRDILKRPDFTNQEMFDRIKRNLLSEIRLNISDNENYAESMYHQMVIPDQNRKYDDSTDINYITHKIESVTLEDLEREYNHLMEHFHSGFVFGNVSKDQFDSFVDCVSITPREQDIHYQRNIATIEGDMEIERDTEQSYIFVTYDIEHLTYPQLRVLYYILNSSIGLCYKTLREKYGLVYSSYAEIMNYDGKLMIYAETDKSKKEKFLQALDEIIADLNNPELMEQFIARAKSEYFATEYTFDENHSKIVTAINSYLLKLADGFDRNEINEGIQNLTSEELLQKTKTMQRKNIFMVRSEEDESI